MNRSRACSESQSEIVIVYLCFKSALCVASWSRLSSCSIVVVVGYPRSHARGVSTHHWTRLLAVLHALAAETGAEAEADETRHSMRLLAVLHSEQPGWARRRRMSMRHVVGCVSALLSASSSVGGRA